MQCWVRQKDLVRILHGVLHLSIIVHTQKFSDFFCGLAKPFLRHHLQILSAPVPSSDIRLKFHHFLSVIFDKCHTLLDGIVQQHIQQILD